MGNLVNLPNITPEVMKGLDLQGENKTTNSKFNKKNYLNTRLEEGETEKELTIRLLPMDLKTGNPFVLTHFHSVKVPKEIFGTEWKSYLCLKKNPDIDHSVYGYKCPFCEINAKAYEMSEKETDAVKKDALQKLSIANKATETVIVRCIERGHEEDGVKFWKFNIRQKDKMDPYNQILRLYNRFLQKSREKGEPDENILDLFNGRDLIVTITDGNSAPLVQCDSDVTPLSKDEEKIKAWVYDEKKWTDVFTPKDYDYLTLVSEQKYPWWDKEKNKWVDRAEFNSHKNEQEEELKSEEKAAEEKLKVEVPKEKSEEDKKFVQSIVIEDNEEELPF